MTPNTTDTKETLDAQAAFLSAAGWGGAQWRPLAGDASTRSYSRATLEGRRALLMRAPPAAESPACPPDADEAARRALGYNAMARLAGPNLHAFVSIADVLRDAGFSAPEIFAADAAQGFALIEDLGDDLYARAIGAAPESTLYENAVDVLAALRNNPPRRPDDKAYKMLSYDRLALSAETDLLMEWYWPLVNRSAAPDDLQTEFREIFQSLFATLPPPDTLVLRDYHAENLLWLPARNGLARTGLIDFQDGLWGRGVYDLVSLLEDARRDVAPDLAASLLARYCAQTGAAADNMMNEYAVLAAQRNAKILGVFARLAKRDGKARYLDLMPRVEAHFRNDLTRDGLEALRAFITDHIPRLAP